MFVPELKRFNARARLDDPIVVRLENFTNKFTHYGFILDQENGFFAAGDGGDEGGVIFGSFNDSGNGGKIYFEGSATAEFAGHLDPALVLLDDPIHCRQTKSGAFADFFGREKRFED